MLPKVFCQICQKGFFQFASAMPNSDVCVPRSRGLQQPFRPYYVKYARPPLIVYVPLRSFFLKRERQF